MFVPNESMKDWPENNVGFNVNIPVSEIAHCTFLWEKDFVCLMKQKMIKVIITENLNKTF